MSRRWRFGVALGLLSAPVAVRAGTSLGLHTNAAVGAVALVLTAVGAGALMFAPGFAVVALLARRWGTRGVATQVAMAMAGGALTSWFVWWSWVLEPWLGRVLAVAVYLVAVALLVTAPPTVARYVARGAVLFGVACAVAVACVGMLVLHGGASVAPAVSERAVFGIPDNLFPDVWMSRADSHQDLRPRALGWPLADRPPLQAAVTMPVFALSDDKAFGYEVSSAVVEGLVVVAVVALLAALRLAGARLLAATGLVTLTAFVYSNVVFVWPKLYCAALTVAAVALLVEMGTGEMGWLEWATVGALAVQALMAHPGGVFGFVALAVVVAALGLPARLWRALGAAAGGALLMGLPWWIFRTWFDTTASVELKWHLAGVIHADGRTLLQTIRDQYASLGVRGWFRHRWDNLVMLIRVPYLLGVEKGSQALRWRLALIQDVAVLWSGGILLLASPVLLARRRIPRAVYVVGAAGLISTLVWTVVEFGPPHAQTVTNNSAYAPAVLIAAAIAAGLGHAVSRRVLAVLVAVQAALCLWVVYPLPTSPECQSGMCVGVVQTAGTVSGSRLLLPFALVAAAAVAGGAAAILLATSGSSRVSRTAR